MGQRGKTIDSVAEHSLVIVRTYGNFYLESGEAEYETSWFTPLCLTWIWNPVDQKDDYRGMKCITPGPAPRVWRPFSKERGTRGLIKG